MRLNLNQGLLKKKKKKSGKRRRKKRRRKRRRGRRTADDDNNEDDDDDGEEERRRRRRKEKKKKKKKKSAMMNFIFLMFWHMFPKLSYSPTCSITQFEFQVQKQATTATTKPQQRYVKPAACKQTAMAIVNYYANIAMLCSSSTKQNFFFSKTSGHH